MTVAEVKIRQQKKNQTAYQVKQPSEVPLLENGDHLTREEFERRYNAMPQLKKAELIEGRVYMASAVRRSQRPSEVPLLENSDHLTREEFERRYNAMPHLKKAELIEGRVYMSSAVRRSHGETHAAIITWLGVYWVSTSGVHVIDNGTIRLDKENEPQPDALLRIESEEGTCQVSEDDYLEGAPELIVEVAGSSASYDLHEKLAVYQRNGVKEYLVWQLYENHLDWFELREGKYVSLQPDADGIIRSRVFPGLYLAVNALLTGDLAEVLAVLQKGLQTEEHGAFVEYLKKS